MKTIPAFNRSTQCKLNYWLATALFMFVSALNTYGLNPGKVEGAVTDAQSSLSVIAAKVELIRATDSTLVKVILTDIDGKYSFQDVPFGKYYLRISGMTYQKQTIPDINITPEKPSVKFSSTTLLPESKSLNEVVVNGYKLTGQIEDDKTTYTMKEKATAMAQSGLDLLKQLPEVSVNFLTNEVTLAGSTNILFQVNGKRVERSYIQQINPKTVEKIEIITNPGSKYEADIDAVINIILKKNTENGLNGRINLEIPTARTFFSNHNANLDYYNKNLHLFVAGWAGINRWDLYFNNTRTNLSDGDNTLLLQQSANGNTTHKYGGFTYGSDWFIDNHNIINFYSTVRPKTPHGDHIITDNLSLDGSLPHLQTDNTSRYGEFYNDYSLFYKHKFDKTDHEISLEAYANNYNSLNEKGYYEQGYDSNDVLNSTILNRKDQAFTTDKWQLIVKADYTCPLTEKIKVSGGYNLNLYKVKNTYNEAINAQNDGIRYNENRNSLYGNISWNIGQLNMQTGIRLESSAVKINHEYNTTKNYDCLLPFASIQYKPGKKQTLRLNYRKSVQRPGMYQLSPFNYDNDAYTETVGNANLDPSYTNKLEFTHRIQVTGPVYVSYKPYFSFTNNAIKQISNYNGNKVVLKYDNVSDEKEYGITFSGSLSFVKWWAINPSYSLFSREIKALPAYGIPAQSTSSWNINVSSQFTLPKECVIFIEYKYAAPVKSHQTIREQNYEFVTGIQKVINKNFTVTVLTVNPWAHRYIFEKTRTYADNMIIESTGNVHYNYIFNIRIGYTFSKGKEGKKVVRQQEPDNDGGGKKGFL
jgi:outer membrane receptor protein involved in Fe transport